MVGSDDRIERAGLLYERAVFGGDAGALATAKRELDGVEADLALAAAESSTRDSSKGRTRIRAS